MKIVILTTSYPVNAGDFRGRFVHDQAATFARAGHDVHVLVPHPGGSVPVPTVESFNGVSVERIPPFWGNFPHSRPGLFGGMGVLEELAASPLRVVELLPAVTAWALKAFHAAKECDVILSHWLVPCGVLGAFLSMRFRVPHVAVEHGGGMRLLAGIPWGGRLLDFVVRHSRLIHFVSNPLRDAGLKICASTSARKRLEERSMVYPMPPATATDLSRVSHQSPLPQALSPSACYAEPLKTGLVAAHGGAELPTRLLFVGRATRNKGLLFLLDTLAGLMRFANKALEKKDAAFCSVIGEDVRKSRGIGSVGKGSSVESWPPGAGDGFCEASRPGYARFPQRWQRTPSGALVPPLPGRDDSGKWTLTVVGDGPDLEEARRLTAAFGLSPQVRFTGLVSHEELDQLYDSHDVLVVPTLDISRRASGFLETLHGSLLGKISPRRLSQRRLGRALAEGVPAVLLEGTVRGIVPVVSDCGGMSDIVRHGESGLTFPPGDSAALAGCIWSLLCDPSLRQRLSAGARASAKRFSQRELLAIYSSVVPKVGAICPIPASNASLPGSR